MQEVVKAIEETVDGMEDKIEIRLNRQAERIAMLAVTHFSGSLRRRAFDVAAAIADFQDEYTNSLKDT